MHGLQSMPSSTPRRAKDKWYSLRRFHFLVNTLYDKVTRPYLCVGFSRFEWYCHECLRHHWEDVPTSELQTYLEAFKLHDFPRYTIGLRQYLIQEKEMPFEDTERSVSLPLLARENTTQTVVHHSQFTPKYLYILVKPRLDGGKFSLIRIDRAEFDEDGDVRAVLRRNYQKHRSYRSRFLHGGPIGIGYFSFKPSKQNGYAYIVEALPHNFSDRAHLPSTSFKQLWRFKDYFNESDPLEMLPFVDAIQDGQDTHGVYFVHHPLWMIYLLVALTVVVILLVCIIWPQTDRAIELLTACSMFVFLYASILLASWSSAKKRAREFMVQP